MLQEVDDSLKDRSAFGGLLLLSPFFFIIEFFRRDGAYIGNAFGRIVFFIFDNINAIIHETGHFSTNGLALFGTHIYNDYTFWKDFITVDGTLFETVVPLIAIYKLYKSEEYFGIAIGLCWLSTSLYHTAWYMSTARADGIYASSNFLGKLYDSVGAKGEHDWFWMFKRTNLLDYDIVIGHYTKLLGFGILLTGLSLGIFLLIRTFIVNRRNYV